MEAGEFFSTLLDIINPLQHIPLVSNLYRELTGDEISQSARMVGGAIFGGPVGFASATANVLLEQASGEDLYGHAVALFSDDTEPTPAATNPDLLAQDPAPEPATAIPSQLAMAATASAEDIVWNAPRVIPSFGRPYNIVQNQSLVGISSAGKPVENSTTLARTQTQQSETLNVARATAAEFSGDFLWNAPQALPSMVGPDINAINQMDRGNGSGELPVGAPTTAGPSSSWLPEALDVAQAATDARNNGSLTPATPPQPWVANAMLEALDKYDALARTRSTVGSADSNEENQAETTDSRS